MKWYLQAETRTEMLEWMTTLRRACKVKNEEKLHTLEETAGLSLKTLQVCQTKPTLPKLIFILLHQKKEGLVDVRHKTTWVTRWIVLKDGILWEHKQKDGKLKAKIALYKCQLTV